MGWIKAFPTSILIVVTTAVIAMAANQAPARVAVTRVFEKQVAPTVLLVGNVVFNQTAGISSEISGLIKSHNIIEGMVVTSGDVLARLNTDFIIKDIKVLDQQIVQLDLNIENTLKNLKRFETLYRQDATTEKNYDDLVYQTESLKVEKERLRVTRAKKALEMEKSVIRAPFDGLVLERYKNPGEWISPGDPVCILAAVDEVMVMVSLSEDLVPFVRVGQSLSLTVMAMDKPLAGRVEIIVPRVNAKSKTFDVKIGIPYSHDLFQNMSAQVAVPTGPVRRLKMIKRDALVRFQGKEFVYTVKDGQAKILPIRILAVDGEYIGVDTPYIVSGMPVVTDGNERLRPDQPVAVVDNPGKK